MSPRKRRSSEEARREILDAAEALLREGGPEAIKLEPVASRVGISHPAILHHFGSREGLMQALVERAIDELDADLQQALTAVQAPEQLAEVLEGVFRVLGERGHGRLVAWMILSDRVPEGALRRPILATIAEQVHALRQQDAAQAGTKPPAREDTLFSILLAATVLFGEAVVGPVLRERSGLGDDPAAAKRFRAWLAELLLGHLEPQALGEPKT